jgi:NAD-dependent SIR2 family protein deacetylase
MSTALDRSPKAVSGGGLSTESGIPDYRGPSSVWRQTRPFSYREFVGDPRA